MNSSLLQFLKLFLSQFSKASVTARLAIVFCVILGYFLFVLYQDSKKDLADLNYNWKIESAKLNERVVSCHEARIKDLNVLFDKVRGIETKVKENTEQIEEVKTEKISYHRHE